MLQLISSKVNTFAVKWVKNFWGEKMHYNEKIQFEREKQNITQKEIAEKLGIKQQQYARYEKGINLLPITHLKEICKYLNVSADYILGLSENMPYHKK